MGWYSLFVVTGKEESVAEWLQFFFPNQEVTCLIPKRRLIERKQGNKQQVLKKMFPGYVLINTEMNSKIYYTLKKIPDLIRIVNTGEYYVMIPQEEIDYILLLLGKGDVVDVSKIFIVNSKTLVKSGPLKGMEGLITTVNKRKMRAKIMVQFMGRKEEIDVGIEVLG